MTILSVSSVEPAPLPNERKPGFRAVHPAREPRNATIINGMKVVYVGGVPTEAEVNAWLAAKQDEEARSNSFNQAINNFSFAGQTLASLKALSNAEFDSWWDANIDSLPKALNVLKLLTRAAIRRLL